MHLESQVEEYIGMTELPDILNNAQVHAVVESAFREDLAGIGDITSIALISKERMTDACILARDEYVVSGTTVAALAFAKIDPDVKCEILIGDGRKAGAGAVIMRIKGRARDILTAERTALNFMQRMTGIATLTNQFVERVKPYGVKILDTRKTTPGLRVLEKYAVLCGGGTNHRMGLFDMVLIKDNHRRLWTEGTGKGLDLAVKEARTKYPDLSIEIEVENEDELRNALRANPEWMLLDNMEHEVMAQCVKIVAGRCKLEASGGITLQNVEAAAKAGVDAISLGCLTHSVPAADLSLEIE